MAKLTKKSLLGARTAETPAEYRARCIAESGFTEEEFAAREREAQEQRDERERERAARLAEIDRVIWGIRQRYASAGRRLTWPELQRELRMSIDNIGKRVPTPAVLEHRPHWSETGEGEVDELVELEGQDDDRADVGDDQAHDGDEEAA